MSETERLSVPKDCGSNAFAMSAGEWSMLDPGASKKNRVRETQQPWDPLSAPYRILIVEDSGADLYLIRAAIAHSKIQAELLFASDGEKALEFIRAADSDGNSPVPDLILLDLNLPGRSGTEVLKGIRLSSRCARVSVLIVSSSDSVIDLEETKGLGASGYFRKPASYSQFMKLGATVEELLCRKQ